MDVSRCQNALPCPDELSEWADWLSAGLHGRNRWRLIFVLCGMLFATGRRTVTSWLRAAGVCTDYKAYYYFLGSIGRNSQDIATGLLWRIFREAEIEYPNLRKFQRFQKPKYCTHFIPTANHGSHPSMSRELTSS